MDENIENNTRHDKNGKIFRIFSMVYVINAVLISVLITLLIIVFTPQMAGGHVAFFPGVGIMVSTFIIVLILDNSLKYRGIFRNKKISSHWFLTVVLSQISGIAVLVFYLLNASLGNFNITFFENMALLVYSAVFIIGDIIVFLLYIGIKNLGILRVKSSKFKKIKFRFYIVSGGLIFILITSCLAILGYIAFIFPPASILNGNGHTDGPWLSWSNNKPDTSISMTWLTSEPNTTVVYYGENPSNLNLKAYGTESGECYLHKVTLNDLKPKTTYYYRIPETFEQDHTNTLFNFTTASSDEEAFTFAIYGDVQPTDDDYVLQNQIVADGLINGSFDFICKLGDDADDGGNGEDWHRFFQSYGRIAANTPCMNVIGNHDWELFNGGSSNWGALYNYPFNNTNCGRYYSFDYHNAHMLMLDNFEHVYSMSDTQLNWIKEDINNTRARDPDSWIFIMFHLAMFTTATTGHIYSLQQQLLPIFDEYNVDAAFFAHDHHYEHYNFTYGANNLFFDQGHEEGWTHNNVQYFCSGGGGANLEVSYGIFDEDMKSSPINRFWNSTSAKYEQIPMERRPWNRTKYVPYTDYDFARNYTHQSISGGEHQGKYYYHAPDLELYDDYAGISGFDYGEQAFQYIQIEIDGDTCTISARYPNGVLLSGPDGNYPQMWTFTK